MGAVVMEKGERGGPKMVIDILFGKTTKSFQAVFLLTKHSCQEEQQRVVYMDEISGQVVCVM